MLIHIVFAAQVFYKVRGGLSLGQLMVEPYSTPVLNFSQADLSALRVSYQHTTPQSHVFTDHATNDSFVFDVVAPFSLSLTHQVCFVLYKYFINRRQSLKKSAVHKTTCYGVGLISLIFFFLKAICKRINT